MKKLLVIMVAVLFVLPVMLQAGQGKGQGTNTEWVRRLKNSIRDKGWRDKSI